MDLAGGQLELISAVLQTGTPTVVIIMGGRPQTFGVATNVREKSCILSELKFPEF